MPNHQKEEKMLKALLKSARELVSDPARWTQGTLARDVFGHDISPYDIDAVCYCGIGAVSLKSQQGEMLKIDPEARLELKDRAHELLNDTVRSLGETYFTTFPGYQDFHTHTEMLAVFDLAIERAPE
jgi:hypothetical protein